MALPDLDAIYRRESANTAVMVADGQNVTVTVRNRQLKVCDGVSSQRRERVIPKAPHPISRLVILGTTGYVTLEAFRWAAEEGIAISQIDRDGSVIASAPGLTANTGLRKAQFIAQLIDTPVSVEIAKRIMTAKLTGQAEIARTMLNMPEAASLISAQCQYITNATSIDSVLGYEGRAAGHYWDTWQAKVTVPFSPTDLLKVPARWRTFNGRVSQPGATDVINAMLNYAYRLAESEAVNACHANGLDPSVSLIHAMRNDRYGMALDLMEAARPACDQIVLQLLDYGQGIPYDNRGRPIYYPANWVYEIQHGVTRLFAPLTHMLAEHTLELAEAMSPIVADVTRLLATASIGSAVGRLPIASGNHVRRYAPPRTSGRPLRVTSMPMPESATDVIPDEAWQRISHAIPVKPPNRTGGARRMDDRAVIAGLVWTAANNLPTTRVPESLQVSGHTLYQRRKRWIESGDWPGIVRAITRTVLPGYRG